jgi:imidazole glycerol-phosphate synthase subunit HisH
MKVALIQSGNYCSVLNALRQLGINPVVTLDQNKIVDSDKVIFPGVGHAYAAMNALRESGLERVIPQLIQPFLGICVGMQLLCASSEEGESRCLGIFNVPVKKLVDVPKLPHMGWNTLLKTSGPLFKDIEKDDYVYFVHSFAPSICSHTSAECVYEASSPPFSAALHRDNFHAVQFHPEKSGEVGFKILSNFLSL